jgi:large subunit ribosomal protein L30
MNIDVPGSRNATTMSKLIITQIHSQIKCPKRQKATLKALGLGRIGKFAEVEGTPQIRGMVEKVHHLVSVKEA